MKDILNMKSLRQSLKRYLKKYPFSDFEVYSVFNIVLWRYEELKVAYSPISESFYIKYINENSEKEKWKVFFTEKNNESQIKYFKEEKDACSYFYDWVIKTLYFR